MNGRNTGMSVHDRRRRAALAPVEQFGEGRAKAVPHLLDPLDVEAEGVGQRLLRQPRRNADP